MTEFLCTARVNGKKYKFLTSGAVTASAAIYQFTDYLFNHEDVAVFEMAQNFKFKRVKVPA